MSLLHQLAFAAAHVFAAGAVLSLAVAVLYIVGTVAGWLNHR